jgi:hypothetical protein
MPSRAAPLRLLPFRPVDCDAVAADPAVAAPGTGRRAVPAPTRIALGARLSGVVAHALAARLGSRRDGAAEDAGAGEAWRRALGRKAS